VISANNTALFTPISYLRNIKHCIMKKLVFILFAFTFISLSAQKKQITIEDAVGGSTFKPASFSGFNSMNDGISYTDINSIGDLVKYELKSGNELSTLLKADELTPEGKSAPIKIESYTFRNSE
jgi:hypothetical protein